MAAYPLENITSLPETRNLCSNVSWGGAACPSCTPQPFDGCCCASDCSCAKDYWDQRSRGEGGDLFENPVDTSSAVENLLCYPDDRDWDGSEIPARVADR
jgi:hypothetical protein